MKNDNNLDTEPVYAGVTSCEAEYEATKSKLNSEQKDSEPVYEATKHDMNSEPEYAGVTVYMNSEPEYEATKHDMNSGSEYANQETSEPDYVCKYEPPEYANQVTSDVSKHDVDSKPPECTDQLPVRESDYEPVIGYQMQKFISRDPIYVNIQKINSAEKTNNFTGSIKTPEDKQ